MADAKNQGLDLGVERTPENTTPTSFRQWLKRLCGPRSSTDDVAAAARQVLNIPTKNVTAGLPRRAKNAPRGGAQIRSVVDSRSIR
jgi:hypothetical protein